MPYNPNNILSLLDGMARELATMEKKIRLMRTQVESIRSPQRESGKTKPQSFRVGNKEYKI